MRVRIAFGVASLVAIATACQLIAGIGDRTIYDGGGDTGVDPCSGPDLPPAPDPSTSSPGDSVTVTAALAKVMLGSSDGGPYYGFNLDKTCTCPSADSCKRTGSPDCDDPNGVDNYARRAFEQINAVAGAFIDGGVITEQRFNTALTTGLSGALIEITGYNGQANDAQVVVTIYASQGFVGYPDAAPAFNGTDQWIIEPSSYNGQFKTKDAWVTNYKLVATNLNFPIIIGSATTQPVTIQLNEGIITADLVTDGGALVSMNGQLGGRWDPAKFLPSLQVVPDPISSGQYLCGDASLTYAILKQKICNNTDINATSSGDVIGSCNSVSMGLGFQALPAAKGPQGKDASSITPCGPNWTDDCP
jgi:hypothetical protein